MGITSKRQLNSAARNNAEKAGDWPAANVPVQSQVKYRHKRQ